MLERVAIGDMVFLAEGREGIGAVRAVAGGNFSLYIENAGEFEVPATAITGVHDRKVIVDPARMPRTVLDAIGHAHDREDPDVAG